MIEAVYDRKNLKLTVKGHANYAEPGADIVCSAASILVLTLAGNVAQMSANKRQVRKPVLKIELGDSEVSCKPIHGMTSVITIIFDSICSGFDILMQKYPNYVKYTVLEG